MRGGFKGGFKAPTAGTAMCTHRVAWDGVAKLERPRPCARPAKENGLCGLHLWIAAKGCRFAVSDGGFCVVCAAPAATYIDKGTGVRVSFCTSRATARVGHERRS